PVSRAVTWYSSTVRGPLSVACASLFTRAQDWSTVRGARTGSVKATRRTRVADVEGVRRRSRAVATRKAGEEPVKAWARTLPSVAWLPVGSDRKSTRLNSSHVKISYAVFCLKKKNDYSKCSW